MTQPQSGGRDSATDHGGHLSAQQENQKEVVDDERCLSLTVPASRMSSTGFVATGAEGGPGEGCRAESVRTESRRGVCRRLLVRTGVVSAGDVGVMG